MERRDSVPAADAIAFPAASATTRALAAASRKRRVMFGAGYRIYFGLDGTSLVLLLVGGTKATQAKDVGRAQDYWRDYLEEK